MWIFWVIRDDVIKYRVDVFEFYVIILVVV